MILPAFGAYAGGLNVLDAAFVFDKFAYPLRNVTGTILLGHDEKGVGHVDIRNIRGRGAANAFKRLRLTTAGVGSSSSGGDTTGGSASISDTGQP